MELKLEHLQPYLLHNLVLQDSSGISMFLEGFDLNGIEDRVVIAERIGWKLEDIKPVLVPLEKFDQFDDLMDEMSILDRWFFKDNLLSKSLPRPISWKDKISMTMLDLIVKHHIDIFGLIDNNLAIKK